MNNPIFMRVDGTRQGQITAGATTAASIGNAWQDGHTDEATVKGYTHNITIPRDPLSGQPSGQRVHSPVVVTKLLDKSSPLLMSALVTGERLDTVEIRQYRTNVDGKLELFYTTVLTDAIVIDISPDAPHVMGEMERDVAPLEHVSFSYRKITWRHDVASTSAEDDWRKGIGA